jgi:uncharacterized protein YjeT (DUF2065 family)
MSELAKLSILIGCAIAAFCAPLVIYPRTAGEWVRRLPRNKIAAWMLTAIDLLWAAWLVFSMHFGRIEVPILNMLVDFDRLKPLLFILTPVSFFLIVLLMDDLLAPRALGGLFLLIPSPILEIARWHESQLRLVMVVFAYLLVVTGITLVLSPHLMRKVTQPCLRDDGTCRVSGVVGIAFGLIVVVLGATVY